MHSSDKSFFLSFVYACMHARDVITSKTHMNTDAVILTGGACVGASWQITPIPIHAENHNNKEYNGKDTKINKTAHSHSQVDRY